MQRQALRPATQLFRQATKITAAQITPISQIIPITSATAGPSRLFSSTPLVAKKAKLSADKPAKGKVRAQDDPVESDVDTEGVTEKTKVKMDKAVTYARGSVYDGVERIKGRVSSGKFFYSCFVENLS